MSLSSVSRTYSVLGAWIDRSKRKLKKNCFTRRRNENTRGRSSRRAIETNRRERCWEKALSSFGERKLSLHKTLVRYIWWEFMWKEYWERTWGVSVSVFGSYSVPFPRSFDGFALSMGVHVCVGRIEQKSSRCKETCSRLPTSRRIAYVGRILASFRHSLDDAYNGRFGIIFIRDGTTAVRQTLQIGWCSPQWRS